MKSGIILLVTLLFSACTMFPFIGKREQIEDRELERFYQELAQEIEKPSMEQQEIVSKMEVQPEVQAEEKIETQEAQEEIKQEEKQEEKLPAVEAENPSIEEVKKEEAPAKIEVVKKEKLTEQEILFVGDSVMKGSEAQLQKMFPKAIVDSTVSRQFTLLPDILRKFQNRREGIPDIVVIHLGSNGSFQEKKMEEAMKILGNKRKVFFVNCKVERPWQEPVNVFLKEQVGKYPNASLIDWYQVSAKKSDYFAKDGVHPNKTGAQIYRQMIQQKLEKEF